ncbi:hypothetical protein GCM10017673_38640 [Streptosporangium violaceochromogenes]|nr:hypothetical protein GCM10017673_38640 [Streptosporangium violaceochromogenes]
MRPSARHRPRHRRRRVLHHPRPDRPRPPRRDPHHLEHPMNLDGPTPELQAALCRHLAAGLYLRDACTQAAADEEAVRRWLGEGAHDGAPAELRAFWQAIEDASAQARAELLGAARAAARGGTLVKEITRARPDGAREIEQHYSAPDPHARRLLHDRGIPLEES